MNTMNGPHWGPPGYQVPPKKEDAHLHDVTTALHSDGNWWASCQTCGWYSPPCSGEQAAMVTAGRHHEMLAAPKKKMGVGTKIVLLTVAFFTIGLVAVGASGGVGGAVAKDLGLTAQTVTYKVEGTTKMASITYENAGGDTSQQSDIDVPLTRKVDGGQGIVLQGMHRGDFLYISAQNSKEYGSVTCIIEVDGVVVEQNTSHGGYTIATCSGRL